MEKIVNNDGYLRSRLMDIAQQLLNICNETGNSNIQLMTSSCEMRMSYKDFILVEDCIRKVLQGEQDEHKTD